MAFTNDLDLSTPAQPLPKPATAHVATPAPSLPPAVTSATLGVPVEAAGKLQWKTDTYYVVGQLTNYLHHTASFFER
jgi:hypothetical protein